MTRSDLLTLARLGHARRARLGAVVRVLLGRPCESDTALPPRAPGEALTVWAARALGSARPAEAATRAAEAAAADEARGIRAGLRAIVLGEPGYPRALAEIPDPPPALWVRGAAAALGGRLVAVVGARAASTYGVDMARALGAGLAACGVTVVSGLARGIDAEAHAAAVEAGGISVAVLGSGADHIYPPEHGPLADALVRGGGAVVSEWAPGTPPRAFHFPLRNRLISGLSSAVVVVEAAERSGSLITAASALDQGREVMAVPGPVRSGRHRGAHALLRDGATLVESAEDVARALDWDAPIAAHDTRPGLPPPVVAAFGLPPETIDFTVDEAVHASGLPVSSVLARLLTFEVDGVVRRVAEGRFAGPRANVTRSRL